MCVSNIIAFLAELNVTENTAKVLWVKPQPSCSTAEGCSGPNRQHRDWLTADIHGTGSMPAFVGLAHVFPMGGILDSRAELNVGYSWDACVRWDLPTHMPARTHTQTYTRHIRQTVCMGEWWQSVTLSEHNWVCTYEGSGYCLAAECLTRADVSLVWETDVTEKEENRTSAQEVMCIHRSFH